MPVWVTPVRGEQSLIAAPCDRPMGTSLRQPSWEQVVWRWTVWGRITEPISSCRHSTARSLGWRSPSL